MDLRNRIIAIENAVSLLGDKWRGRISLSVVGKRENLPARVREYASETSEGVYDPIQSRAYLIAQNIHAPERAVWVAAHEVVGHGGLRMLGDEGVDQAIEQAERNPFIKRLSAEIARQRDLNPLIAVHEALAETSVALETGNYGEIQARYGVAVPLGLRDGLIGYVGRVSSAVKGFVTRMMGSKSDAVADADIRRLLDRTRDVASAPLGNVLEGRLYTSEGQTGFYSALERSIPDMAKIAGKDGTVLASQAQQWLSARQKEGKFKAEEILWTGLDDWLSVQTGRVSVADIESFVRANGIKVMEVEKSEAAEEDRKKEWISARLKEKRAEHEENRNDEIERRLEDFSGPYWVAEGEHDDGEPCWEVRAEGGVYDWFNSESDANEKADELNLEAEREARQEVANQLPDFDEDDVQMDLERDWDRYEVDDTVAPKYEKYTLGGSEDYRELLLLLPVKRELPPGFSVVEDELTQFDRSLGVKERWKVVRDSNDELIHSAGTPEAAIEGALANLGRSRDGVYRTKHWDEGNVLAHIRFNTRTGVDGARTLFIEEIQSDWGQEAKAQAKKDREAKRTGYQVFVNGTAAGSPYELREEADAHVVRALKYFAPDEVEIRDVETRKPSFEPRIPDGPFISDTKAWVSLAVKRMVRYAVEHDFDQVALISGKQSADKYDLSQQVDQIRYQKKGNGTFDVWASDEHGCSLNNSVDKQGLSPDDIEKFVGKEVAKKIVDGKGRVDGTDMVLEGVDLKVGGEGMLIFYDSIVPQVMNDVLKRLDGGRVGEVALEPYYECGGRAMKLSSQAKPMMQPGFVITPELRAKVLRGMPLFSEAIKAEEAAKKARDFVRNADSFSPMTQARRKMPN